MRNSPYVLVINLGLKSTRAIVFDVNGKEIAKSSRNLESFVNDQEVEQDGIEWWIKTEDVIQEVLENREIRKAIRYITVTCSSSCLIAVDRHINPITRIIMVSDKRAIKETKQIAETKEFLSLVRRRDVKIDSSFMLPKILWIKNNLLKKFRKVEKFLSPNDYLLAKLTGQYVTDTLNAEKYYFDPKKKSYPKALYKQLEIPLSSLPHVVDPGTLIGTITPLVAKKFGLLKNVEVVVTTYDAIAAVFGSGVTGEDDACDISGTITSVRTLVDERKIKQKNNTIFLQLLMEHSIAILGATSNQGGSIIEWLRQTLYSEVNNPYKKIEDEAKESILGAWGLLFLPYLFGERSPLWNPNASAVFFGLQRSHKRHDLARAVLESTGFLTKSILDEIEGCGVQIKKVKMAGGLAAMELVSQLKADILGKEVFVTKYSEASAFGVFLITLVAAKIYPDISTAVKQLVTFEKTIKPNMGNHKKYKKLYELYKNTYLTIRSLFEERKHLIHEFYNNETLQEVKNL